MTDAMFSRNKTVSILLIKLSLSLNRQLNNFIISHKYQRLFR